MRSSRINQAPCAVEAPGIATELESAERIPVRSDERRSKSSLLRLEVEAPGIEPGDGRRRWRRFSVNLARFAVGWTRLVPAGSAKGREVAGHGRDMGASLLPALRRSYPAARGRNTRAVDECRVSAARRRRRWDERRDGRLPGRDADVDRNAPTGQTPAEPAEPLNSVRSVTMPNRYSRLSLLGRTATFPGRPKAATLETFRNENAERDYKITFDCREFTSMCPVTGQPDFAHIRIEYIPDEVCIESKSLKFYLASFRSTRAFNEAIVNRILDDIVTACRPRRVIVHGEFAPRGGIGVTVDAEHLARPGVPASPRRAKRTSRKRTKP